MYIPVEEAFAEWRKDLEFVAAYDALEEEEFALAASLIRARADAEPTQRPHTTPPNPKYSITSSYRKLFPQKQPKTPMSIPPHA